MSIELKNERFKQCYYKKIGTGFPLFLVHGFGENSDIFKNQLEELEKNYTLILPDLPGSGKSKLCEEEITMELLADFIFEIIEQEKFEKIIFFGHSMGGYLGMSFLEKYEHKLAGFGLIHSSSYEDDETKKENRRKSVKLIEKDGKEVFLKAMIPNLYSEQSKLVCQNEMQEHLTMALEISSESLVAYYNAMINRTDKRTILQHSKVPILYVVGKQDNAIPYMQMIEQASLPLISKIEILENVGHTSMNEAKIELNDIINKFCLYVFDCKLS